MPPENTVPFVQSGPSVQPINPLRIGKFKASRMIVKESWAVLKQDKEILWFPILSAITSLIVFALFASIVFFGVFNGDFSAVDEEDTSSVSGYLVLLVYYLISFFIVNFFQAGVLVMASARFKGQNASFNDGIREATSNIGKIFAWSFISATVGVILHIIADRFKIIGKIVAGLLGAAWSIMTYFSLPALIIGKSSIRNSFKESAQVIRKTWGETIIANLGVGLFFGVLILVAMLVAAVAIITAPTVLTFIIVGGLFLLFIIGISIISSTLSIIFKLALYEYARTGVIPSSFTPELVQHAVKAK